mgnify:CR=1 FL=1
MVINQKNKYEMKHNLALFLGKISDDFVNWLFEHLSRLKQQQQQQLTSDDSGVDIVQNLEKKSEKKDKKSSTKKEDKLKKTIEHQQQQKDKKKETISNKRKITAKSTTTEESSSSSKQQRLPKKKLKSAVVNLDAENRHDDGGDEENNENDDHHRIQSQNRKRTMSNDNDLLNDGKQENDDKPLVSKNVLEKCPSTIAKANDDKIDQVLNEKSIETNADVVVKNPTTTMMTTTKTTASIENSNNKIQTKFFVTLDGVKNMFKVATTATDVDDDDLFLMDEELDPELMNEDFSNISDQFVMNNKKEKYKDLGSMMMMNNNNNNKFERCRYWPSCMNGNKCDYYHPIIKCK